tara:strand:- start:237 stop:623 length:387 start_codon:yes stop_codon:yes gene_type:complete
MISLVVHDLIGNTAAAIKELNPKSIDDIRGQSYKLAKFSDNINFEHLELKRFLNTNLYKHPKVMEMTNRAEIMIQGLFDKYMLDNDALPDDFKEILKGKTEMLRARKIADYIAGMTDRFAIAEFKRLI